MKCCEVCGKRLATFEEGICLVCQEDEKELITFKKIKKQERKEE
jgi:hypothetical protein